MRRYTLTNGASSYFVFPSARRHIDDQSRHAKLPRLSVGKAVHKRPIITRQVHLTFPSVRRYISRIVSVARAARGRPLSPPPSCLLTLLRCDGRDTVVLETISPSTCRPVRKEVMMGRGGGGGTFVMHGRSRMGDVLHSLLALIIGPLTTHPFRDGAPFLPLLLRGAIVNRDPRYTQNLYFHYYGGGIVNRTYGIHKNLHI